MKFVLSLIICSSVASECMPPFDWQETFRTKYDCLTFGYEESLKKMKEIGREEVNKHGIYLKFYCTPVDTIWQYGKIVVKGDNFSPLPTLVFPSLG